MNLKEIQKIEKFKQKEHEYLLNYNKKNDEQKNIDDEFKLKKIKNEEKENKHLINLIKIKKENFKLNEKIMENKKEKKISKKKKKPLTKIIQNN